MLPFRCFRCCRHGCDGAPRGAYDGAKCARDGLIFAYRYAADMRHDKRYAFMRAMRYADAFSLFRHFYPLMRREDTRRRVVRTRLLSNIRNTICRNMHGVGEAKFRQ